MEQGSWNAVAIAAIAMAGGFLTAWVKRKSDRDRMEFDTKLAVLQQQHADCEANHAAVEAKLVKCEEQHRSNESRLTALEEKVP